MHVTIAESADTFMDALVVSINIGGVFMGDGMVTPFTPQEVWWAIRDHFYHHGGFLVRDAADVDASLVNLTPQEVWWSLRDGYFFDFVLDQYHWY